MGVFVFDDATKRTLEQLRVPLAVYRFVNKRVVTVALSDGFCELFGFDDKSKAYYMMDHDMYEATHPDDKARVAEEAVRFATQGGRYEVVYRTHTNDHSGYRIVHSFGEHVYTPEGERLAIVWYTDEGSYQTEPSGGTTLNSSLGKALHEESFFKSSSFDYLTGLPNMSYFFELAETWRISATKSSDTPAVLFFNICGMRHYNKKFGFSEGDRLLRRFADILKKYFSSENCCRFGSDHFGVYTVTADLEATLDKIFAEIPEIPVRVGICTFADNADVSTMCDRAKYASDSMRGTYYSNYRYFNKSMLQKIEGTQYITDHFDQALDEGWIQVYYQPIVRAANGRVCHEEALARWIDPKQGPMSPAYFVPVLEDARLIYRLDLYVLDQVLKKMQLQAEKGLTVVPSSINLSRVDFEMCDIVEEIRRRVDAAGMAHDMLNIEITESAVAKDNDFMLTQIQRFRNLGFRVWMDDFGSGYSSLDLLQSLPFDLIKFDMRFMKEFDSNKRSRIILTELIKMTLALDIDTVCEGVETIEQAEFLREIGCTMLQGYYFTKPIPMEEIIRRYSQGIQIGFENPLESSYYAAIGKINLYDLAFVAADENKKYTRYFNTLPMAIIEAGKDGFRLVRSNSSFRAFYTEHFGTEPSDKIVRYEDFSRTFGAEFVRSIRTCNKTGKKMVFDEETESGMIIHAFLKTIAVNPVTGTCAYATVVLAVSDAEPPTAFSHVAKALAAEYISLYCVNLRTDHYTEYLSEPGTQTAKETTGDAFFETIREKAKGLIVSEDLDAFLNAFNKGNVVHEVNENGSFAHHYRISVDGKEIPVLLKAVLADRVNGSRLIVGVTKAEND